ncbi:DUF2158 domain-containing protein [Nitrincola tibetensis]|uniref:DUF2158 domain-containing protein n=1 Tax=Nitrincola tibetensis TaxID=2219697 RepID=A0A364NRG8_9GAMM|nr:DUF2158 domain-containing protein [Nitrincola tibetensis]RAU19600.1 DUF2158 domain-containing protein [Nitrincola tibetensis]
MANQFNIGDIVQLKSGGPKMTVTQVRDKYVSTAWFAGSKKEDGIFPMEAIVIFEEKGK